jgi:hypothetical protein
MYIEYYQDYYRGKELRFSANSEKIFAMVCFFLSVMLIMKHKEELKILQSMYKEDVFGSTLQKSIRDRLTREMQEDKRKKL